MDPEPVTLEENRDTRAAGKKKQPKEPKPGMNYCGYLVNEAQVASAKKKGVELREKRCKMEKKRGAQWCPHHEISQNPALVLASGENPDPERVPCPYSACQ